MAIGPGGTARRSCSLQSARLAPHAVLDPADSAPVHAVDSGDIHSSLTPRQSQTDFADLSVQNLRTRVAVAPRLATVPQTVSHVAGVITEIQIIRPVVTRVIIVVADELVPAELPTQDNGHYRAVQHYLPLPCHSC